MTDRYALIGDIHCRRDNLEESSRLMSFVRSVCVEHNVRPIFMGDQYDDHGIARVEVQNFLLEEFNKPFGPGDGFTPIALVGNHDLNHEGTHSWMKAHSFQVTVVDAPYQVKGQIWALPYYKSNEKFLSEVNDIYQAGGRAILCHQEFNGCELGNGFYSPNGVDPNLLPKDVLIISGHIHTQQSLRYIEGFGHTILYVGAPRHRTRSDVGRNNFVVLWSPSTGQFVNIPVPETVCEPFRNIVITPETADTDIGNITNSARTFVDIYGPKDFIKKVQKQLPDSVKCRTFPEKENVTVQVKESDGIPKAFTNYALDYASNHQLSAGQLQAVVGKIYEKCPLLRGE